VLRGWPRARCPAICELADKKVVTETSTLAQPSGMAVKLQPTERRGSLAPLAQFLAKTLAVRFAPLFVRPAQARPFGARNVASTFKRLNYFTLWTSLAIFLIGLGYIALLPPFEGFDEYAHYSSIRQIADTGKLPLYGESFVDQNVEQYMKIAPMPGGTTYQAFFANAEAVAHFQHYRGLAADWIFAPGSIKNWEAQHPPLYYLLMAPIMRASEQLSLPTQILILRSVSYMLAFVGLMIGWRATWRGAVPDSAVAGYLFYPLLIPMFFGEFARIGNDSLCILLIGLIYSLALRLEYQDEFDPKNAFALGICFALGLLTKAFFIPVLGGYALLGSVRAWHGGRHAVEFPSRLRTLSLVVLPALFLGGGWYLYDIISYGSPIGSDDSINLAQRGGLIAGLRLNFSVLAFTHEMLALLRSWSWAGSWSFVHVSPLLHLPLFVLTTWVIGCYGFFIRQRPLTDPVWLPVWVFTPFFAGLIYHIFVSIALGGGGALGGGTPGWYLNLLAPFLAFAVGYGVDRIVRNGAGRILLGVSLIYAAFFLIAVIWSQAALFAGCAVQSDAKLYQFDSSLFCLDQMSSIKDHLSVVAWPALSAFSLGGGFICLTVGLFSFFNDNNWSRAADADRLNLRSLWAWGLSKRHGLAGSVEHATRPAIAD
jgi:hypothetical protein